MQTIRKKPLTKKELELIISSGAIICKKLKILYADKSWYQIGSLFSRLKKNLRELYAERTDLEFHRELEKYGLEDLQEAISAEGSKK